VAEKLIRDFQLITLRVSLVGGAAAGRAVVRVQLEGFEGGTHTVEWGPIDIPLAEFGIPSRIDPSDALNGRYELRVPEALVTTLRDWMGEQNEARAPLWIYLVKPYGYLGLVPWERDIVDATSLPVLRLPDFLEPPLDTDSPLDIAVVCSVPPMVGKAAVRLPQLEQVVEVLANELPRASRVHVFCGDDSRAMAHESFDRIENVTVYDPQVDASAGEDAWFRWILQSMEGTALDAVHFIAHGIIGADCGLVALAASPTADARGGYYPAASEIDQFLTSAGAWCAAFHVPWDRTTDLGVRFVADSLGMIRPGTVLVHDGNLDTATGLHDATALIYATERATPPVSPAVFVYIQPSRVANPGNSDDVSSILRTSTRRERWDAQLPSGYQQQVSGKSMPGYVRTVERMAEKWAAVLDGNDPLVPSASPLSPTSGFDMPYLSADEQAAVDATISKLRKVVAEFALEELAAGDAADSSSSGR